MAHRQDTGRMMRPSPLVVALALLIVMVGITYAVVALFGVGGGIPQVDVPVLGATLQEVSQALQPTSTSTPLPTQTPTVTPSPTPTPIPRLWTEEEFDDFMHHAGFGGGEILLDSGWYLYDGVELLDDYPCLNYCSSEEQYQGALSAIRNAFVENNDADFWCEWACQGVYNGFGNVDSDRREEYYAFRIRLGEKDKDREPFCPQFASPYYDHFSCRTRQTLSTPVPRESLAWTGGVRTTIENKYLYPILYDGWDRWPGIDSSILDEFPDWDKPLNWTREDVSAFPDTYVCWIIANGHYYYGWPEYNIPSSAKYASDYARFRELRLELRAKLNNELGVSVDGNPPLCPGFLDMIEPAYLP